MVESALCSIKVKKNEKQPLSSDFIKSVIRSVDTLSLVDLRDACIISLAYSLLLRHDEVSHICCNHLSLVPGGLKVLIPSSKTDVFKSEKSVFLASGGESTPSFNLLFSYMKIVNLHIGQIHFLFCPVRISFSTGFRVIENKILSYSLYRSILWDKLASCGLNPDQFGFHSSRKGGASNLPWPF